MGEGKKIPCGENGSVEIDGRGNFKAFRHRGDEIALPLEHTYYEIDGDPAPASEGKEGTVRLSVQERDAADLRLTGGEEVCLRFDSLAENRSRNWSLTLPFPLNTEFHLPEYRNIGRTLDADMPVGDFYTARLAYNFLLIRTGGVWVRLMSRQRVLRRLEVAVTRHPDMFLLTCTWHDGGDAFLGLEGSGRDLDVRIGLFSSMEEARDNMERWMEGELGLRKLRREPELPEWIHDVPLVFTVDMMRSYGEISHDFTDVTRLAEELAAIGCPPNTLFYLPGWNGPFDSTYPTYRPAPALGGEDGFRRMAESLHAKGYRLMIHTIGWGIDPFHPDIERLLPLARRDKDGNLEGYKFSESSGPPSRRLRFRADRVAVPSGTSGRKLSFHTVPVPGECEGHLSLGGGGGAERKARVTLNGRSQTASGENGEYAFPFPFRFEAGRNRIELEISGGPEPDWSRCWYGIDRCFVPKTPFGSSTHPILWADTGNPEWIRLFVDEVAAAVGDFGVDAVHVDATVCDMPSGADKLLRALRERLPAVAIGGEWCASLDDVGYWTFCQGATGSLLAKSDKLREPGGQGSLPVRRGLDERYRWLDKTSPVCGFVGDYVRIYPHLCAANGFVPIGKICDIYPKRLLYTDPEELWEICRDFRRLDYVPALRVNYREHGLDEYTARVVRELIAK